MTFVSYKNNLMKWRQAMEPKIVTLRPLYLAGQPYYGNPEGGAFSKAWERFDTQHHPVPGRVDPKIYYGLQVYGPEFMSEHHWLYMPSVQVNDLTDLPGMLFGKTLPACTYAVFTAQHGLPSIPDAFMEAYQKWIPNSDYEIAYPFDFELYDDDRFQGGGPEGEIDIYIPVRKKTA
jgi:AraC family transcriptional regulator